MIKIAQARERERRVPFIMLGVMVNFMCEHDQRVPKYLAIYYSGFVGESVYG
jgi:hypothetical protein